MKKLFLLVAFLCCYLLLPAQDFRIIAYTTAWSDLEPDSIRYDLLTHINYSFLIPAPDGSLEPLDDPARLQSVVKNAHEAEVEVFISIGGWNLGDGGGVDTRFELLAADPASRSAFIGNVVNFVETYQLDGVDMDWEYPDARTNSGQSKPSSEHFYDLMLELNAALEQSGKQLTMAVVGANERIGAGIPSKVFDVVDWVNIMAYDKPGGGHHSSYEHAVECLDYWIGKRGLPEEKAVLGLPFYGKYPGTDYRVLVKMDPEAPEKDRVNDILYNGPETMRAKTRLAMERASGVMFWELAADVRDPEISLLKAINDEVKEQPR